MNINLETPIACIGFEHYQSLMSPNHEHWYMGDKEDLIFPISVNNNLCVLNFIYLVIIN